MLKNVVLGDINGDSDVDLRDFILTLQAVSGFDSPGLIANYATSGVDVDGDDKIGLAEVIYVMQKVVGSSD